MLQLRLQNCQRNQVETISDSLESIGALSITLSDSQDDPILEPALGTAPLWPTVDILALFLPAEQRNLEQWLHDNAMHAGMIENLPEEDWLRVCLKDLVPQQFGKKLWICPSWINPPDPSAINVILDPGLAFGTGTHPTTALCLTWLEQAELTDKTMIDYGCGSGILAMAALKLGAEHVYAVDIDDQALQATQENAANNAIDPWTITLSSPENLNASVDILLANILLEPLVQLAERFNTQLKKNGRLVVSGLLAEQAELLIDAYADVFDHQHTMYSDGWVLMIFARK